MSGSKSLKNLLILLVCSLLLSSCSLFKKDNPATPTTVDLEMDGSKDSEFYGPRLPKNLSQTSPSDRLRGTNTPYRPPKIGLVLGPGGTRGFAHLGVIKELEKNGIRPNIVVGSGFGSLVGGIYSSSGSANRLEWELFKLREDHYFDPPLLSVNSKVAKGKSILSFLNRLLSGKTIQSFKKKFGTTAIRKRDGKLLKFQRGHAATLIRTSLAVPGIMQSIRFGGNEWISGSAQDPLPIEFARKMGAEIVIAVDVLADVSDISSSSDGNESFKGLISAMSALSNKSKTLADFTLTPDMAGIGIIDFQQRGDTIYRGKQSVSRNIEKIKQVILTWEPPPEEFVGPSVMESTSVRNINQEVSKEN